jgi:hypothetical protein
LNGLKLKNEMLERPVNLGLAYQDMKESLESQERQERQDRQENKEKQEAAERYKTIFPRL